MTEVRNGAVWKGSLKKGLANSKLKENFFKGVPKSFKKVKKSFKNIKKFDFLLKKILFLTKKK